MVDTNNQNISAESDSDADLIEETASLVVSEIIKKYNLKDLDEEFIEKIEKGESFIIPGAVINDAAKKIALAIASDEDIKSLLENRLGIQKKDAEELIKDIKTKIVPIIKNLLRTQERQGVEIPQSAIKRPIFLNVEENEKRLEKRKEIVKPKNPVVEKSNKIPKKTIVQERPKSSGPDSYREPIK